MKTNLRRFYRNKSGFSLIELIIAMAVLAIIVATFTTMLTSGLFGIVKAGEKSTNIFLSQEDLEKKLSVGTTIGTPLTITFTDLSTITIQGEIVEFPNGNVSIRAFLPRQ